MNYSLCISILMIMLYQSFAFADENMQSMQLFDELSGNDDDHNPSQSYSVVPVSSYSSAITEVIYLPATQLIIDNEYDDNLLIIQSEEENN